MSIIVYKYIQKDKERHRTPIKWERETWKIYKTERKRDMYIYTYIQREIENKRERDRE